MHPHPLYGLVGVSLRSACHDPQRNPNGIDTMPGLRSGNQAKSAFGDSEVGVPETTGEKNTSTTAQISPP